ncbi:unnamed protein product [Rotaria socialis]|uniref:FHA domain-containing protein n=1 Tax=Rotaria socialis TaxID=392032 RepID=A0A818YLZ1_9BILA|nr:unnamed protein product [Rotaria socialis]CAF4217898.1 unnamed protein product [Rotaria socialis]
MADTFKVPPLPSEEPKEDDTVTSSTVEQEETSHAPFVKPELPPTNFSAPVRHKNLHYTVPESSTVPPIEYTLEVLRNGSIIDYIALSNRPYTAFGRSPDSDVVLEHPTISRYHAIVQYKSEFEHGQPAGLYVYDCGSTHGTFVNKKRLEPKTYVRIKIGFIIKFGQSTRLYLVQGDTSAEAESIDTSAGDDLTHEKMKQFHAKRAKVLAAVRAKRESAANEANTDDNIEMDWGMGSETDESAAAAAAAASTTTAPVVSKESIQEIEAFQREEENKKRAAIDDLKNRLEYQQAQNDKNILKEIMSRVGDPSKDDDDEDGNKKKEPFYLKEPKRTLTAFFEREGAELTYDVEDRQFGSFRCTIKLPIVDEYGRAVQAECEQKHCKRKEIIQECIIEACRILDDHGVLREGTAASSLNTPRVQQIKRKLLEENDFYEEDEDTFYDRTGELEKKRLKRMEWSGLLSNEPQVESFESLCLKLTNLYQEQVDLEHKLEIAKQMEDNAAKNAANSEKDIDEIDLYIRQLKQGEKLNLKVKWQWRKRLLEIENEERQFAKLLRVCKPREFNIQSWRQKLREEAKQNLIAKPLPIPSSQLPHLPKPVIETKPTIQKEQMPPPPPVHSQSQSAASSSEDVETVQPVAEEKNITVDPIPVKKPKKQRKPVHSTSNSKDQYDDADHYSEEKFAEWMPPENEQTGDGRTALNEKYGY